MHHDQRDSYQIPIFCALATHSIHVLILPSDACMVHTSSVDGITVVVLADASMLGLSRVSGLFLAFVEGNPSAN